MFLPKLIEQFLIATLLAASSIAVNAQQIYSLDIKTQNQKKIDENKISIFKLEEKRNLKNLKARQHLADYNVLSVDADNLARLVAVDAESISLDLPIGNNVKTLKLQKTNFLAPDFKVRQASNPDVPVEVDLGLTYSGKVDGDESSIATISFLGKEVIGVIAVDGFTYNLGKLKEESNHIIYKEHDLDYKQKFTCHTTEDIDMSHGKVRAKQLKSSAVDNCVKVYVETGYDVYQERGSVTSVTNFITSLFAQVSILYANEQINLSLGELFVWDINDPYNGDNPGTLLNEFMERLDNNFNGDVAHLINFNENGGIAYVDALCSPFAYGMSGIDNFFSTVPTYSWSVGVLAHEIGHNLGSPHTHACAWNGNNTPIDGCGDDGDGCAQGPIPTAGTIMSYCHQTQGVGIDLSLGFGPQPGDLIRQTVSNASCLAVCGDCDDEGQACNDGDPCTTNDTINAACNCVGTYTDVDLDGVCAQEDPDDDDPCVPNDCPTCTNIVITVVLDNHPNETSWEIRGASGDVLITSGGSYANFDRGSTVTSRLCASDACYTFVMKDKYGDGICCGQGNGSYTVALESGEVLISGGEFGREDINEFCIDSNGGGGSSCSGSCDDGDPCTTNDQYDEDCDCKGTPKQDSDGDGICDDLDSCPDLRNNLIGTACDDGDPCTTNDKWNANCNCEGTPTSDSDGDGVCDENDSCPNLDNSLIGKACDDGNPCTVGEKYDANCNCTFSGTIVDRDNDGVCAAEDTDDNDPCVPNACGGCLDVVVEITLDNYPGETRWDIVSVTGEVMLSNPRYFSSDIGKTRVSEVCLPNGCYQFKISDSFGDGICCAEGNGGYVVKSVDGTLFASGGQFGRRETKDFCTTESGSSTCSGPCNDGDPCTSNDQYTIDCNCVGQELPDADGDGICDQQDSCPTIHNNDFGRPCDDGDDCTVGEVYSEINCNCSGGEYVDEDDDGYCIGEDSDDTNPCIPDDSDSQCAGSLNCSTVNFADFENNWGIWRSGGRDATRARFKTYANSGDICIRLRDNTDESTLTSDRMNLTNFHSVKVTFSYYPLSMDNSAEDFWLQLSTDGRRTFTTVEEWNKNDEFVNDRRYTGEAIVYGPFTDETHLRFRCDASNNADIVFIDDIKVERCTQSANNTRTAISQNARLDELDFRVYPNPVKHSEELQLLIDSEEDGVELFVYDLLGKRVMQKEIKRANFKTEKLNTSQLEDGTYMILVTSANTSKVRKVMVVH